MTRPFDSGEREPQLKATREKTTAERTDDARRQFFQVWMVIGAAALIYMFGFVLDVLGESRVQEMNELFDREIASKIEGL